MLASNPLVSPLLAPTAGVVLGALGVGLAGIVLTVRGRVWRLRRNTLFQRWLVWAAIAPMYGLTVLAGPLPTALFASVLGIAAAAEVARLLALTQHPADRRLLVAASAGGPLLAIPLLSLGSAATLPLSAGLAVLSLLPLVAGIAPLLQQDVEHGARRAGAILFGLLYVALGFALLPLIALHPAGGPGVLLVLGLAIALSDVGAFTVGRLVGQSPLAPRLSPNKTWEGAMGNVVGAAAGVALLLPLVPAAVSPVAVIVVVSVGAVLGDLLESLLKRCANVKDSGGWLPGFGGLLDRVDSLLVVLPLTAALLAIAGAR